MFPVQYVIDDTLPAFLEELPEIHDFQKLSEYTKCFPKPLHVFRGLK